MLILIYNNISLQIGKSRYVSVNEFRGRSYVNIREYYDDKGVEKPGKKGAEQKTFLSIII